MNIMNDINILQTSVWLMGFLIIAMMIASHGARVFLQVALTFIYCTIVNLAMLNGYYVIFSLAVVFGVVVYMAMNCEIIYETYNPKVLLNNLVRNAGLIDTDLNDWFDNTYKGGK